MAGDDALLLTTQDLEEADQLADRISVLDHGQVIAAGTSAGSRGWATRSSTVEMAGMPDSPCGRAERFSVVGPVSVDGRAVEVRAEEGGRFRARRGPDGLDHDERPECRRCGSQRFDDVFLSSRGPNMWPKRQQTRKGASGMTLAAYSPLRRVGIAPASAADSARATWRNPSTTSASPSS